MPPQLLYELSVCGVKANLRPHHLRVNEGNGRFTRVNYNGASPLHWHRETLRLTRNALHLGSSRLQAPLRCATGHGARWLFQAATENIFVSMRITCLLFRFSLDRHDEIVPNGPFPAGQRPKALKRDLIAICFSGYGVIAALRRHPKAPAAMSELERAAEAERLDSAPARTPGCFSGPEWGMAMKAAAGLLAMIVGACATDGTEIDMAAVERLQPGVTTVDMLCPNFRRIGGGAASRLSGRWGTISL